MENDSSYQEKGHVRGVQIHLSVNPLELASIGLSEDRYKIIDSAIIRGPISMTDPVKRLEVTLLHKISNLKYSGEHGAIRLEGDYIHNFVKLYRERILEVLGLQ